VQRASYAKPITITQVIQTPTGTVRRPLPGWAHQGWMGLRRFLRLTITNTAGKVVGSSVTPFCPSGGLPQRTGPNTPPTSPFPFGCFTNPFERGMVWALQRGWGTDPVGGGFGPFGGDRFKLRLGTYKVKLNITLSWRRLLHIPLSRGTATTTIHVVKGSQCKFVCPALRPRRPQPPALPRLPSNVPTLTNPPMSVRPDLAPLPSWGIGVQNHRATTTRPASAFLSFGATVWIGGNSRLDVEGFRSPGAPTMTAWQYFFQNGKPVAKAPAGTMGFDTRKSHTHWHFQQFAQYRLLNANKKLVVRSRKVGFCIAPTDAIDLLLRHAVWQQTFLGFGGGACGSPTALWVQESLPNGWGDTYFQFLAGQSFDISKLPNGTYYIEIIANPLRRLIETNYRNNTSLRKVILGGTTGHRTVTVPAFHGIDPEH
jgi:hypothetical protein